MKQFLSEKFKWIKIWETGIILFAAMGFWGMIYPDLCFTQNVCVSTNGNINDRDMFTQICEADSDQLVVKSRFLERFSEKDVSKNTKMSIKESKGKKNAIYK